MELTLSEDQELFHETTVRFIEAELPIAATRQLHDDPIGFERPWWKSAAELGWFTMLVPEEEGGGSVSGSGLIDATIIAEEVGRHVQPGPFIPTNIVALAVAEGGSADQKSALLPQLMSGDTVAAWAFASVAGFWDLGAGLTATRDGRNLRLDGFRGFVQDAVDADVVLVVADLAGETLELLVPTSTPGLQVRPLEGLDLSRRMSHINFDNVIVAASDAVSVDPDRLLQTAVVLNLADTVGAMDALMTMTVSYAKDRIAFGRPIGSFQALKHILADQALHLETSKAGVASAARALHSDDENAAQVVSMVAAYVGDVADELAQMSLQIHGGIGYTWEHDLHLLMRRVRSNAALYGTSTWHRERVCALYEFGGPA
ncbi:MAG: acyl-CoA dehydrogenase family protein [Rhodococcus fascians]